MYVKKTYLVTSERKGLISSTTAHPLEHPSASRNILMLDQRRSAATRPRHVQRKMLRAAFVIGKPVTSRFLVHWVYGDVRKRSWHWWSIRRSALQWGWRELEPGLWQHRVRGAANYTKIPIAGRGKKLSLFNGRLELYGIYGKRCRAWLQ